MPMIGVCDLGSCYISGYADFELQLTDFELQLTTLLKSQVGIMWWVSDASCVWCVCGVFV